jgi:hypothetical protein
MSQNPFRYAVILKDSVYPPVYSFRYFVNYDKWNDKKLDCVGGFTFNRFNGITKEYPEYLEYDKSFSSKIVWPPDFLMCSSDFLMERKYDYDRIKEETINYDGRLCCDNVITREFYPNKKTINMYLFGTEDSYFEFGGFRFLHNIVEPDKLRVTKEEIDACREALDSEKSLRGE